MLFLRAEPLETTPLLFRDLDSQLLAFPYPSDGLSVRWPPRLFFSAAVLALSRSVPLLGPGVSWCCRISLPEPNSDSAGCPVLVRRPKTV